MESNTHLTAKKGKKRLKTSQIFIVAATILLTLFVTILCIGFMISYEVETDVLNIDSIYYWNEELPKEQQVWYDKGIEELNVALSMNLLKKEARNVIIFIAHGISPPALAAARFWSPQSGEYRANRMSWDKFPHLGKLKNTCSHSDVCDPFTIATAIFGGVKTNFNIGGLDVTVPFRNCSLAANRAHHIKSIFQQAQDIGLRTGFVTTRRVTSPTAASLYAHTPDTSWECDAFMPKGQLTELCEDIAQQLVNSTTGRQLNVVMGGGRQMLVTNVPTTKWDPIDEGACNSLDGRNLMRDWKLEKILQKKRHSVLQNREELQRFKGSSVDYVMGIFANSDLRPMFKPNQTEDLTPTLKDMVNKAIEVLKRDKAGYLLLAETGVSPGGNITKEIEELSKLNDAVEYALKLNSSATDDTLALVVFTKGTYIKSTVETSGETQVALHLLDVAHDDLLLDERLRTIVPDTFIYAKGPKSYLFHGLHEETYMAHVVALALKMGQFDKNQKGAPIHLF